MRPRPGSPGPLQGACPRPDQSAAGPHGGPSRELPEAEGGSERKGRASSRARADMDRWVWTRAAADSCMHM